MALKLLDIEYLRAQNSSNGQVLTTGINSSVEYNPNLVVKSGQVGIGSSTPTSTLSVSGNISIFGQASAFVFADGTRQTTSAVTLSPGGIIGSVQYNAGGAYDGTEKLFWDTGNYRLGIGTSVPKSTLQIKDVGYESTDTSTDNINPVVLDSFPVPDYRSCHYIVQVTDTNYSWFHTAQIMLVHDGSSAFKSEYNIVVTHQKLGEFDCRISNGNVELIFEAFYTSEKNIKVIRTSIEP